jgi:hypothetical protein
VRAGGVILSGVKSLKYSDKNKPGAIHGTSSQKKGRTRGQYEPDATLELYRYEYNNLITLCGPGFMLVVFDVQIDYRDTDQPICTDLLKGCRIAGQDFNPGQDGSVDASTVSIPLDYMALWPNGIPPLPGMSR